MAAILSWPQCVDSKSARPVFTWTVPECAHLLPWYIALLCKIDGCNLEVVCKIRAGCKILRVTQWILYFYLSFLLIFLYRHWSNLLTNVSEVTSVTLGLPWRIWVCRSHESINSSRPSDAYIGQGNIPTMLQIVVCRLFGTKPLSEPILPYCQLDIKKHISLKLYLKFKNFHAGRCT